MPMPACISSARLALLSGAAFALLHLAAWSEPLSWQAAWTTSLQAIPAGHALPSLYKAPEVAGRTVRQIVYPVLNGHTVRLKISNRYGSKPLLVAHAGIARAAKAAGAALVPETGVDITFGGRRSLLLAPGAEAESDAVVFDVVRSMPLAISLALGPGQRMQAWHRIAGRVNYISTSGDHVRDVSGASFPGRFTQFAWITQLSVAGEAADGVVAIGDSITDGMRATLGARRDWPDLLDGLLAAGRPAPAILNAGISGNRLLSDSPCYGARLVERFGHDAAELPGVRVVIVLAGINDINFADMPPRKGLDCDFPHTRVHAADLIAGYRRLIDAAHRRGLRILGGTLTPAALPPAREVVRIEVNHWIRHSGQFDGVIDFDAALRDPARPSLLRSAFDSGDHVHPSDAGYAAMAHAVPLAMLRDAPAHGQGEAVAASLHIK